MKNLHSEVMLECVSEMGSSHSNEAVYGFTEKISLKFIYPLTQLPLHEVIIRNICRCECSTAEMIVYVANVPK